MGAWRGAGGASVLLLIVSLLLASTAFARSHPLQWQPYLPPGVFSPSQFGVQVLQLTGPVELEDGKTKVAKSIVYLKSMQGAEGKRKLRAVAYFYDAQQLQEVRIFELFLVKMLPVANWMMEIKEHPAFTLAVPKILLEKPDGGGGGESDAQPRDWTFDVRKAAVVSPAHRALNETENHYNFQSGHDAYHTVAPYFLSLEVPEAELAAVEQGRFCIADWYDCVLLPRGVFSGASPLELASAHKSPTAEEEPTFVVVLKPFFSSHYALISKLLFYHSRYYREIGFRGSLLYERGGYLDQLVADPQLRPLLADGTLNVMMWTHAESGLPIPYTKEMDLVTELEYGFMVDQWAVYTHAALALSGTNTWAFFADADEFLKLPVGQSVQGLFAPGGCLHGTSYVQIPRFNYMCDHAGLQDDVQDAASHAAGEGGHAAHKLGLQNYLACRERESIGAGDGIPTWPKSMMLADAGAYMHAHDGLVFPEYAASAVPKLGDECASVVHLHNLMRKRDLKAGVALVPDAEWFWPFERMDDKKRQPPRRQSRAV